MTERDLESRIIHEASHLFACNGFAKTSVREIVEAAGATKPTLYYYFGSKAGLFKATLDYHMGMWSKTLKPLLPRTEVPVIERIKIYLGAAVQVAQENPHVMMLMMRAHLDASEGAPQVDLNAFRQREKDLISELIQQGIDGGEFRPHRVEDSVCSLMGTLHFRLSEIMVGVEPESDIVDRILDTYLNGVGA